MKKLCDWNYLIEGNGQLDAAIKAFCSEINVLFYPDNIYLGDVPNEYPYVAIMNHDNDRELVCPVYVKVTDFEKSADDDKGHLFEFNVRRVYLVSPYRVRESLYQIPAKDIFKAMIALGQAHSRDEEYDLEVISWNMVR